MNAFASETIIFSEDYIINDEGNAVYSIIVTENSNIAGLSLTINYDKESLDLLDASVGGSFASAMNSVNKNEAGIVIMSSITTSPIVEEGTVISLVFDGAINADVSFSVSECIDKDMHNLSFNIVESETNTPQPKENTEKSSKSNESSNSNDNSNRLPLEGKLPR